MAEEPADHSPCDHKSRQLKPLSKDAGHGGDKEDSNHHHTLSTSRELGSAGCSECTFSKAHRGSSVSFIDERKPEFSLLRLPPGK